MSTETTVTVRDLLFGLEEAQLLVDYIRDRLKEVLRDEEILNREVEDPGEFQELVSRKFFKRC